MGLIKVSPTAAGNIDLVNSTKALRTVPGYKKLAMAVAVAGHSCTCCQSIIWSLDLWGELCAEDTQGIQEAWGQAVAEHRVRWGELVWDCSRPPGLL